MINISNMAIEEFVEFQRQFSDEYLTHVYHQWAYSDDMWGDFLCLFSGL